MDLGSRLRIIRKLYKKTQKQVGEGIGFSSGNAEICISQYERNAKTPRKNVIEKFSNLFSVPVWLIKNKFEYTQNDYFSLLTWAVMLGKIDFEIEEDSLTIHADISDIQEAKKQFLMELRQLTNDFRSQKLSTFEYMDSVFYMAYMLEEGDN